MTSGIERETREFATKLLERRVKGRAARGFQELGGVTHQRRIGIQAVEPRRAAGSGGQP